MIMNSGLISLNLLSSILTCINLFLYVGNIGEIISFLPAYFSAFLIMSILMINFLDHYIQGMLCIGLNIATAISTAESLQTAIKTKNYNDIDERMAISSTLASII